MSSDITIDIKTYKTDDELVHQTYFGVIICPTCKEKIRVHSKMQNETNKWIISGFVSHFTKKHREYLKTSHGISDDENIKHKKLCSYFECKPSTLASTSKCAQSTSKDTQSTSKCAQSTILQKCSDKEKNMKSLLKNSRNSTKNLSVIDSQQNEITLYFEYIDKIIPIVEANCSTQLKQCIDEIVPIKKDNVTHFIMAIFQECDKGAINKYANRYSQYLKDAATYLFLLGGRQVYEILSANLKLPSAPSIAKYMEKTPNMTEGELFAKELKNFLVERGLPLQIFLSEDGTKIVPAIKYDSTSNQIIGKYI